ncbi:amidohydrolase [Halobacillus andaensis]|uniref:Amidohydrolase n=1 Tax=Halobacillus andaensis TaxID=1176239 RepID=A0A917B6L1_HALAA|nr:amidohydrolase [Halobacillus andaensis]MBP2005826.1 putative amidohydrolase YtcJ [Halobacillus andaensis]GGF25775.1 amidohydrolase [Halobacillus andaensis]
MILDNVRIYQPYEYEDRNEKFAVEIQSDKIKQIHSSPYTGTEPTIDGEGKVLSPGFNDSHMHLLRYGLLKKELDLTEANSYQEMKELIENHYENLDEGGWFFGKGFNDDHFEDLDQLLTAKDLNDIQANAYIYLLHEDGHECVISEKAMELLKQEEAFKKEPEEFKEKDEDGNWTGRFKDTAVHYINHRFWGRSVEDAKQSLLAAFPYLSENGLTSVHTDDRSFIGDYDRLWQAYTELEEEGKLPIDVQLHHYIFDISDLTHFLETHTRRTGDGTNQVKVGAIKIFLDGTQRLHTASMRNPYPDDPNATGPLIYSQNQLNEMVSLASENNMQVAMHAIGDRAVEQAIEALEQKESHTAKLRHRIIHAQTLAPDLIQRLQKIKPYIETQPSFLLGEWDKKHLWTPEELLRFSDPFKSLVRGHIPITLSSDLPIGSINPLVSIYTAVNRMDLNQQPQGGWMPQEKLSVNESFHSFTVTPSYLEYGETRKGKIAPGYQADFVILDQHPLEIRMEDINKIQVTETWQRGKRTYKK